ncbi:hypothetical protein [Dactylosporangium sp. NPDC048998]|uniref:hypothetical protein n=1 Tax=Dactylosporangium sp. NPDC048998 TaxID=3363976 RepID=UPI00371EF381
MRVGRLILLPVLALVLTGGLSGCSAPTYETAVDVYVDGDQLVLGEDLAYPYGLSGHVSQAATTTDGVHTLDVPGWRDADHRAGPARSSCLADEPAHCFRAVAGHLAVEETTDGTNWRQVWAVPDSRRAFLARQYPELGPVAADLSTLAVAALRGPSGVIVAAANGRDGFALRDGAGHWQRIGFPPHPPGPLSFSGRFIFREYGAAALLAAALILLGAAASRRDRDQRIGWGALLLVPVAGWALLLFGDYDYGLLNVALSALVLGPIVTAALVVGLLAAVRQRRWRSGVAILGVAAVAGAAVALTFNGWSAGRPASYSVACLIALAVTAPAAAGVLVLARRVAAAGPADDVPAPGATFADVPPPFGSN